MRRQASKIFSLFITLIITILFLGYSWDVIAQGHHTKKFPLSKDDPAAWLDPDAYKNAKPIPEPRLKGNHQQDTTPSTRWVLRDLQTGRIWVEDLPISPRTTSGTGDQFAKGLPGQFQDENVIPEYSFGLLSVIGPDSRKPVTNTTTYPWSTICKLWMTFHDGIYMGTGAMVGLKGTVCLTAGHCIYESGSWAKAIEVIPGLYHNYKPYGSYYGSTVAVPEKWVTNPSYDYDMGIIIMKKNIGYYTGTLGYAYFSNIDGSIGNLAGYPGDKGDTKVMYWAYGPAKKYDSFILQYTIDCASGQSGSPVYGIVNNNRWTFAVHSHHNPAGTMNYGTFVDKVKFNWIKKYAG